MGIYQYNSKQCYSLFRPLKKMGFGCNSLGLQYAFTVAKVPVAKESSNEGRGMKAQGWEWQTKIALQLAGAQLRLSVWVMLCLYGGEKDIPSMILLSGHAEAHISNGSIT